MRDKRVLRFTAAGGVLKANPVPEKDYTPFQLKWSMKKILRNKSTVAWYDKGGGHRIVDMEDTHLINAMRFLIQNHDAARRVMHEVINVILNRNGDDLFAVFNMDLRGHLAHMEKFAESAAVFYARFLPCFPVLSNEILHRFSADALGALYQGL